MHRRPHSKPRGECALLSLSYFFLAFSATAQDSLKVTADSTQLAVRNASPPVFRTVENQAFGLGERLVFDVGYGFFHAGEAVMAVNSIDTLLGRPCYRVNFDVWSTGMFSFIYKVRDHYESLIDVSGLFPWKFEQRIQEGGYRREFSAVFDHYKGKALTSEGEFDIPEYVHDVVSAFYFVRTLDFTGKRPGEKIRLQNFYKDQAYPLDVKYLGRQTLEVDAGKFDCIIVEPLVKEGGLFKSEGRVIIWLTDDEQKIPVKVSTKVLIGSIDAELKEYSGVLGPIRAKHSDSD
jgi:hypothetical protein